MKATDPPAQTDVILTRSRRCSAGDQEGGRGKRGRQGQETKSPRDEELTACKPGGVVPRKANGKSSGMAGY